MCREMDVIELSRLKLEAQKEEKCRTTLQHTWTLCSSPSFGWQRGQFGTTRRCSPQDKKIWGWRKGLGNRGTKTQLDTLLEDILERKKNRQKRRATSKVQKKDWNVQKRFGFVKIEGSLKYAIPAVDRGRGHRYLTEIDAFSLRSYRKTRSNLNIYFGHIINHLSTFPKLDIVSKNL